GDGQAAGRPDGAGDGAAVGGVVSGTSPSSKQGAGMRSSSRRVGDVLVLLALALGVGCGVWWVTARLAYPSRAYASTPAAVQAQCEDARTFEGFFPSAEACLSYFDGSAGVPEWKCEFKSPEVEIIATMLLDVD